MKTMKELRKFGWVMAAAFVVIALARLAIHHAFSLWWIDLSLFFALAALVYPKILRPIYRGWMALADVLSWIVTRVILVVAFYLIVTPISLLAKISNKQFLALAFEPGRETYWRARAKIPAGSVENQF